MGTYHLYGISSMHEWKFTCIDKTLARWFGRRHHIKEFQKWSEFPNRPMQILLLATDGKYVVAFFGSGDRLFCYDMGGKLLWQKNFGLLKAFSLWLKRQNGICSSPVIYNGVLIIQCDVLENCFCSCIWRKTGKELWKTQPWRIPRMCTPTILTPARGRLLWALNVLKKPGRIWFWEQEKKSGRCQEAVIFRYQHQLSATIWSILTVPMDDEAHL